MLISIQKSISLFSLIFLLARGNETIAQFLPGIDVYHSAIPKGYKTNLFFIKIYYLLKGNLQGDKVQVGLQMAKTFYHGVTPCCSKTFVFPKEIIFEIFKKTVGTACCIAEYGHEYNVAVDQIKREAISKVLRYPMIDFSIKAYIKQSIRQYKLRFSGMTVDEISAIEPSAAFLEPEDIGIFVTVKESEPGKANSVQHVNRQNLQQSGLIYPGDYILFPSQVAFAEQFSCANAQRIAYESDDNSTTYCFACSHIRSYFFFKTFNAHPRYSLSFKNRGADEGMIARRYRGNKCVLSVYDRTIGEIIADYAFNDYIENCFCSKSLLFVELMKKIIYSDNGACPETTYRANHRIEVYDLTSKKRVNVFSLPLLQNANSDCDKPKYELVYVDDNKIYLNNIEENRSIGLNYYDQNGILSHTSQP